MRLSEVAEPIFQYVCRLNRSARLGVDMEPTAVRADLEELLGNAERAAATDPRLADQWSRVELPVIYFIDFMIKESRLAFAADFRELAYDRDKQAGDQDFFILLDETLADSSEPATERLEVFFACMGLGFTGMYKLKPNDLKMRMQKVAARLRSRMDTEPNQRIVPEAYENVDTTVYTQPAGRGLLGLGIAVAVVAFAVVIGNAVTYVQSSRGLGESLRQIEQAAESSVAGTRDGD